LCDEASLLRGAKGKVGVWVAGCGVEDMEGETPGWRRGKYQRMIRAMVNEAISD
jgi:hypothetical protein